MAMIRYPQFCALARALELLGERWTLLIVRELLLGPKRFSDLRAHLDGISPSVLAERLTRVEALGLVRRSVLPPPAASTVYELTEDGLALRPAVFELIRWGGRFLLPAREGERIEPEWMRLALAACARRGASPPRSFLLRIREGAKEAILYVAGGPTGTVVTDRPAPADVTIVASVQTILALMSGAVSPLAALEAGRIETTGDPAALAEFPQLFDAARPEQRRAGP
ncbi:MAG: transcriptional regulator [Deltaproteobacteria bacterium]|nr:transcriptional regulator [Deltaproteobacteria bacterium]